MPQNAKTIPTDRSGHLRASITASNILQMAKISELKHRDLAAITLEGKKTVLPWYSQGSSSGIIYKSIAKRFSILLGIDSNAHSDIFLCDIFFYKRMILWKIKVVWLGIRNEQHVLPFIEETYPISIYFNVILWN